MDPQAARNGIEWRDAIRKFSEVGRTVAPLGDTGQKDMRPNRNSTFAALRAAQNIHVLVAAVAMNFAGKPLWHSGQRVPGLASSRSARTAFAPGPSLSYLRIGPTSHSRAIAFFSDVRGQFQSSLF